MKRHNEAMPSSRMEAFSDGVVAVIITIMVLELHVPHADGLAAMREMAPRIGIYLLSFILTAIYWLNHHELLRRTERVNYHCLLANLLWLCALSLVPLSTDYVEEKHFSSFAVAQYATMMLLAAGTFGLLRIAVLSVQRQHGSVAAQDKAEARKHILSMALNLLAVVVAFWHPMLSLALTTGIVLVWVAPWLATGKVATAPFPHESAREESR